jgi:hypothetical protein
MPRAKIGIRTERPRSSTATIARASLAIVLACVVAGCNSQSFQESNGPSMPAMPPVPVQPPAPPMNPARQLNGNWFATYPGGPLRVVIGLDPMMMGRNYVATLVDGNKDFPPGKVMWRGTVDQNVPNLVVAQQACATSGLGSVRTVKARIVVTDLDHVTEELVDPKACGGFPVKYTRASAADAPQRKN